MRPRSRLLERWIRWAGRRRIGLSKRLAAIFHRHRQGIHDMLVAANSSATAGSVNANIESAMARARGFRTVHNLRTVIYLLEGSLDLMASPYAPAA